MGGGEDYLSVGLSAELDTDAGVMDVPVDLWWHRADPWTVIAVFATPYGRVVWCLGRDLLAEGLQGKAGAGLVWVHHVDQGRKVAVMLPGWSGSVCLCIGATELARFLAATFVRVPRGAELAEIEADLDAELLLLLDDPGGCGLGVTS